MREFNRYNIIKVYDSFRKRLWRKYLLLYWTTEYNYGIFHKVNVLVLRQIYKTHYVNILQAYIKKLLADTRHIVSIHITYCILNSDYIAVFLELLKGQHYQIKIFFLTHTFYVLYIPLTTIIMFFLKIGNRRSNKLLWLTNPTLPIMKLNPLWQWTLLHKSKKE